VSALETTAKTSATPARSSIRWTVAVGGEAEPQAGLLRRLRRLDQGAQPHGVEELDPGAVEHHVVPGGQLRLEFVPEPIGHGEVDLPGRCDGGLPVVDGRLDREPLHKCRPFMYADPGAALVFTLPRFSGDGLLAGSPS